MALVKHRQEGLKKWTGSFLGDGTIVAGKGFTVTAPGSGVYRIALQGPEPFGAKFVCLATMQHAADHVTTTDAVFVTVLTDATYTVPAEGKVALLTYDLSGNKENAQTDSVIHFEITLYTSTQVV